MTWLESNLINIVLILLIIALLYGCIRSLRNDHKRGCSGCGQNCAQCSMAGSLKTLRRQLQEERKVL